MRKVNKSSGKKALELTIQSRTENLRRVRDFVSDAARTVGFDDESVQKIALAVDEACTNIIKHSYHFAADKDIEISIMTSDGIFEVVIADKGSSFDPRRVEIPDMKEYIRKYRRGGLGMVLMRSLMDVVEYKTYPGAKNTVRLVKYLRANRNV